MLGFSYDKEFCLDLVAELADRIRGGYSIFDEN